MKIRLAVPENGCLVFLWRMEKNEKKAKKKKNKKTSVKHICIRLIGGCIKQFCNGVSQSWYFYTFCMSLWCRCRGFYYWCSEFHCFISGRSLEMKPAGAGARAGFGENLINLFSGYTAIHQMCWKSNFSPFLKFVILLIVGQHTKCASRYLVCPLPHNSTGTS